MNEKREHVTAVSRTDKELAFSSEQVAAYVHGLLDEKTIAEIEQSRVSNPELQAEIDFLVSINGGYRDQEESFVCQNIASDTPENAMKLSKSQSLPVRNTSRNRILNYGLLVTAASVAILLGLVLSPSQEGEQSPEVVKIESTSPNIVLLVRRQGTLGAQEQNGVVEEWEVSLDASQDYGSGYLYLLVRSGDKLQPKGVFDLAEPSELYPTVKAGGEGRPMWAVATHKLVGKAPIESALWQGGIDLESTADEIKASLESVFSTLTVYRTAFIHRDGNE